MVIMIEVLILLKFQLFEDFGKKKKKKNASSLISERFGGIKISSIFVSLNA